MAARISRLGNGLTVATMAMPGVETAAVALTADVGGRHEAVPEHGLAHLFEHMLFKGTGRRSARAIAEAIEDVGGSLNAWTSRDTTCFHARVLAADLPLAIDVIADLVTDPTLSEADLALERGVILSEIGEALETPDDLVFDHLQAVAFPGQSLGRSILGTPDSLARLDPVMLRRWLQAQYRGGGLVLSAAGRVEHEAVVAEAERTLGGLAPGRPDPVAPARFAGGRIGDTQRNEQLHLAIGYRGFAPDDPMFEAGRLFVAALGGGMSSRLFQELREERGLAYSVSAGHGMHADTGLFSIYAATRPRDAKRTMALAREIAVATAATLGQAELDRARAQLKAGVLMALEGSGAMADWLGGSLLTWGRVLTTAEVIARLDAVTVEEARAAGATMLGTPEALAVVGPGAERLAA